MHALAEYARRLLLAKSVGLKLVQGKLRMGLITWRTTVQEAHAARQSCGVRVAVGLIRGRLGRWTCGGTTLGCVRTCCGSVRCQDSVAQRYAGG